MTGVCVYCGGAARVDLSLCAACWNRCPGELLDRILATKGRGVECPRFQNAVAGAVKFLEWKDGLLD